MLIDVNISSSDFVDKYKKAMSPNGEIMITVDEMVMRDIKPYVPYDSGRLSSSAEVSGKAGSGKIMWTSPYARSVWHGKTKNGADMKFDRTKHPLAGPRWTERYKADHKKEIRDMAARRLSEL